MRKLIRVNTYQSVTPDLVQSVKLAWRIVHCKMYQFDIKHDSVMCFNQRSKSATQYTVYSILYSYTVYVTKDFILNSSIAVW